MIFKNIRRTKAFFSSTALLGAVMLLDVPVHSRGLECAEASTSAPFVNVKDRGATGDGLTDDTAAIQAAIDEIAGIGGTVFVPMGVYMVNAVKPKNLTLKSDMTLKLAEGATLKAVPNSSKGYAVLSISGVSKVKVVGGTLEGERDEHKGKSGEWGMGIRIDHGAEQITINGVLAKKMWGDGFYVESAKDVKFCSVVADKNRRQGLSIIAVDGLIVTNSVFKNTQGTRPSAGIDLEPNKSGQKITNVRIENSEFINNAGTGVLIAGKKGTISNVEITHNVFKGNRPLLVEDAPSIVASAICNNRQVTSQKEPASGLNAYLDPIQLVIHQNECRDGVDMRFEVNR
jgi:polygalacturonase